MYSSYLHFYNKKKKKKIVMKYIKAKIYNRLENLIAETN